MDLKQLRAFVTVADSGSVTRAAVLLNLVQPAVSRQLRLLEDDLGVELFDRSRHGMRVTPAGRQMLEHARRILNDVERAKSEIRPANAPLAGTVTVGLLASLADLLATPLTQAVCVRFPRIRLRILVGYAGHLVDWMESGDVDTALLYDQREKPGLRITPLFEEELWAVAPAAAGLSQARPVPMERLACQPFVLPSAPHGLRTMIEHAAFAAGVALDVAAQTNALGVQKALVSRGHGWTILPRLCMARELDEQQLSAAPLLEPRLVRTVVLASPGTREAGAPVRSVAGTLFDVTRDTLGEARWGQHVRWLAR